MLQMLLFAVVGFAGGVFGSMVGLGGGIFITPCLTILLGVPIHSAIAASLVAMVATSTSGSVAYLRRGLTNLRLAISLEAVLVGGALIGGLVGTSLDAKVLSAAFGGVMIVVSIYMGLGSRLHPAPQEQSPSSGVLSGSYHDYYSKRTVRYGVRHLPAGLAAGLVAGGLSGLLGMGGGFMTVPALVFIMGVPMRAAAATSSLMLGVTACGGAVAYFFRGLVDPAVAVPVVLGVAAGAWFGSRLALRVRQSVLVGVLAVMLFALSVQMILAAAGIRVR